jgi:hypothetical protein
MTQVGRITQLTTGGAPLKGGPKGLPVQNRKQADRIHAFEDAARELLAQRRRMGIHDGCGCSECICLAKLRALMEGK